MARRIRCFEGSTIPIRDDGAPNALTRQQAQRLQALWTHGKGLVVMGDRVQVPNYCGVIGLGSVVLELLPKVMPDQEAEEALTLMLRMLRLVPDKLRLVEQLPLWLSVHPHDILDIFVAAFLAKLEHQAARGLMRAYASETEMASRLRGKLHLPRQAREIRPNRYHQRRTWLSADSPANRLIKHTLTCLARQPLPAELKARLTRLLARFEEVRDEAPTHLLVPRLARAERGWNDILRWCVWFLRGMRANRAGEVPLFSLVFPTASVFQGFLDGLLPRALPEGLRTDLPGLRYMCPAGETKRVRMPLQLDHCIRDPDGTLLAILDSKWKIDERLPGFSDRYQLFTYAAHYGVKQMALLYPAWQPVQPGRVLHLPHLPTTLHMLHLDLHILTHQGTDAFTAHFATLLEPVIRKERVVTHPT